MTASSLRLTSSGPESEEEDSEALRLDFFGAIVRKFLFPVTWKTQTAERGWLENIENRNTTKYDAHESILTTNINSTFLTPYARPNRYASDRRQQNITNS